MTCRRFLMCALMAVVAQSPVSALTIDWAGHTWQVNTGYPMGGRTAGQIDGRADNVFVDGRGRLHLDIRGSGATATGAEVSTVDNMSFGSFYYVVSGPIMSMEPSVVFSGFTYGPANGVGGDGTDELDIEFSRWNGVDGNIDGDFTFYPASGEQKHGDSFTTNWLLDLGNVNTCRIDWTPSSVTASIWAGDVPPTASTTTAVKTATFHGTSKTVPQEAMPMMFNLWTNGAYPTKALDVVVDKFQYIPRR